MYLERKRTGAKRLQSVNPVKGSVDVIKPFFQLFYRLDFFLKYKIEEITEIHWS